MATKGLLLSQSFTLSKQYFFFKDSNKGGLWFITHGGELRGAETWWVLGEPPAARVRRGAQQASGGCVEKSLGRRLGGSVGWSITP